MLSPNSSHSQSTFHDWTRNALSQLTRYDFLNLPLTSELKYPTSKVVVVSHPGWSRRWLTPDEGQELKLFSTWKALEAGLSRNCKHIAAYRTFILPKLWYAERKAYIPLLLECMAEEAISRARARRLTVVVTVPSKIVGSASGVPELIPYEKDGQPFSAYLKSFLSGRKGIYAFPTEPSSGAILGTKPAEFTNDRLFTAFETALGKKFLLPLISSRIGELIFCGGFFDGCMKTTLSYFAEISARSQVARHSITDLRSTPLFLTILNNLSLSQSKFVEQIGTDGASTRKRLPHTITPSTELRNELKGQLDHVLNQPGNYRQVRAAIINLFVGEAHTRNNWEALAEVETHAANNAEPGAADTFNLIRPSSLESDAWQREWAEAMLPSVRTLLSRV
jgi:hypothetical protein